MLDNLKSRFHGLNFLSMTIIKIDWNEILDETKNSENKL